MSERTDLFYNTYGHFDERVLAAVRAETFGRDIGQNSWLTAEEYERFVSWLGLTPGSHVLEVASGSGGPALHLAERGVPRTGIDANESGVANPEEASPALRRPERSFGGRRDARAFRRGAFDAPSASTR